MRSFARHFLPDLGLGKRNNDDLEMDCEIPQHERRDRPPFSELKTMNAGTLTHNPAEQALITKLMEADQGHLFADWDQPGTNDAAKAAFLADLTRINASYPGGLSGDEIGEFARIVAVADVVEAMSSNRPYRPAIGVEPALQEIESGRGVRYDERAVDACLTLFRDKGYALPDDGLS